MAEASGLVRFGKMEVLQRPGSDDARKLLLRVAKQVEPIMQKREWNVGSLIEIIPASPNLLGWNQNKGAIIAIRLRRVHDVDSFFDFHHALGTMLHELCHIVHGPHNAQFYALLDELRGEAEALIDKGIVGVGAFETGTGSRLGGRVKLHADLRESQLQAALKRQRIGSLMSSGKRLGGSLVGKDVRTLAAEAAQRRAADDIWCRDMIGNGRAASHLPGTEGLQDTGCIASGGHGKSGAAPAASRGGFSSSGKAREQEGSSRYGTCGSTHRQQEKKQRAEDAEGSNGGALQGRGGGASTSGLDRRTKAQADVKQQGERSIHVIDLTNGDESQDEIDDCVVVCDDSDR